MRLANSAMVRAVPFFRAAGERCIASILDALTQTLYVPGELIIREGDLGTSMYFVKSGAVEVFLERSGATLARIDRGGFFGEVALLVVHQLRRERGHQL